MKQAKRLFSLLVCLALLLSLATPAYAQNESEADTARYSAVVRFEEGADADAICAKLEALPGIRIRWQYSALFSGAAIEGTRSALALAGKEAGVATLSLSRTWTQAETITDPVYPSNSLAGMNAEMPGYDGDGMIIAVLDTGIKLSHETFADVSLLDEPALSCEEIEAFIAAGGTEGRYVSDKIPFVYDYAGQDRSVHTADYHGTHVSALAVGYALRSNGSIKFCGAAPAAQLLGMKVFPDDADLGADDVDILKAIEDAYLLGADVINLSLGMPDPFVNDSEIGEVYNEVVAALEQAGVVVCCAVGNFGTSLTGKAGDGQLPGTGYTDYGTVSSPSICDGAAAIAAVNAPFYEAGGGLIAGDRTIAITQTISEDENEVLPDILELAGLELDYVVVGGLGREEDFAGLDLTGCIALVQRGEIYFSEKARNAAAAGAVLCIIYNNEPGMIRPAVSDITIPCILITQEDGEYLIKQAQGGRGTMAIAPYRTLISTGENVTMLSYSSWGVTPDLRLAPTLSAPGGIVMSAGITADNAYVYLSGTSMAAPNASGAYALMLQALREKGVEDRAQRLRFANALLQSTAQLVTDENGVPLSPRRQGAGVINLGAALQTGAVIKEPILDLGESGNGVFKLRFTVKNLTQEEKTFSINTTVLTDAFAEVGGFMRSTLTPLDISELVTVHGVRQVYLEPMEEQTVELTLIVSASARKLLEPVYPNGWFTEGYITLTDEQGEEIHATFLGYFGDWEAAPIIESVDFRDVMNAYYEKEMDTLDSLEVNMGYNFPLLCRENMETYGALLLGENPWLVTRADDNRIAMSTVQSDAILYTGDRFVIDLYTLRNAEHVIMVVSDQDTGEIYLADDRAYLVHSEVSEAVGEAASAARFIWDGTDRNGHVLDDGTKVTVSFYAWLESETAISDAYDAHASEVECGDYRWLIGGEYETYNEWSFPLVLDAHSPEVSCRVDTAAKTARITVTDAHYVAYAAVQDESGNYLVQQAYADDWAGQTHTLTVSLEECAGDMLYVTVADYAGNKTGYEIDTTRLTSGTAQPVRCVFAMLTDVEKDAWYHEAVDFAIENGLMSVGEDLTFSPNVGTLRSQVLEMLYEMAGRPEVPQDAVEQLPFTDVLGGAPYRAMLAWAYSEGIVKGYSETLFGAYAPVQRSQLAAMLLRAAQAGGEEIELPEIDLTAYADGDTIPEWAKQPLLWAVEMGYLRADEQNNLRPREYVTRAEFAYILMMFYEQIHTGGQ